MAQQWVGCGDRWGGKATPDTAGGADTDELTAGDVTMVVMVVVVEW